MGLLDDAIRQHLELKRQHGASEEELQRQEEEALGPARREVAPAEPREDAELEVEAAEDGAPDALEDETELYDEDDEPLEAETVLREPESDSAVEDVAPFDADDEAEVEEELEGVPEPDAMPPSPAPFDASTAFEEFGQEDEPAEEDESEQDESEREDADVLEDTPDFLQETPEHDRLWFEQKPPRDFDWDK
jgi:hypothetical protein